MLVTLGNVHAIYYQCDFGLRCVIKGVADIGGGEMVEHPVNMCNWCDVQPAQHGNGECDECWNLPGHEGEGSWPHSEIDALKADIERLRHTLQWIADNDGGESGLQAAAVLREGEGK